MKSLVRKLAVIVPLFALAACAEVPAEAVTLSVNVGTDLEELRRSHIAATKSLFERAKQDANRFIDDVYRPKVIEKFFDTFKFQGQDFVTLLRGEISKPGAGNTVDLMAIVVEEAMAQVSERRASLLAPIQAQEAAVLKAVEDAYANVLAGHALVTANLASVRKVQAAQNKFLADIGLDKIRKKAIEKTIEVSDTVSKLLSGVQETKASISELDSIIEKAKTTWTNF